MKIFLICHFSFVLFAFYFGFQFGKESCISIPSDCVSLVHPDQGENQ